MAKRGRPEGKGTKAKRPEELPVVHRQAAGIDVGSEVHFVAVPEDCCEESVQSFGFCSEDLHRVADWLIECGVTTVAMESTGVYWIPLYQILERRGLEVLLVNAKHVKNVPGRKSDVQDCRWLQTLHTYGLLAGSFRPDDAVCVLRSYMRHRETLVQASSAHVQRMQKALTQMNVQLHRVISDITGVTGLRIIDAIIAGERDRTKLAALRDGRIRKSADVIAKALEGDYREEHVFALRQERALYGILQQKIAECEEAILKSLDSFDSQLDADRDESTSTTSGKGKHDIRAALHRMVGVDLTVIPGLDAITVLIIVSEIGLDMERWPNAGHLASWLRLCPQNDITGGKVIRRGTLPGPNRAANALRMAAQAAGRTQTAIGGFYRRKKGPLGAQKANKATAHKIARVLYHLVRTKQEYADGGLEAYEQAYRSRVVSNLKNRARSLGFDLVEREDAA
jgi:transposase